MELLTLRVLERMLAVLIGGALVAGSALRIVLSKDKMTRLEPQMTPNHGEVRVAT